MFGLTKNKKNNLAGKTLEINVDGMHCASCAANIDLVLEELDGVIEVSTSYAKSTTKIVYDSSKISIKQLVLQIHSLGYIASEN